MTHGAREIGPHRWRETFGRYYEEFEVGDVYEHRPGRTITETDNTWFTLLTMNNHPLHFDTEYAAQSEFKKPLVNSCLTLSIVVGMSAGCVPLAAGMRVTLTLSAIGIVVFMPLDYLWWRLIGYFG